MRLWDCGEVAQASVRRDGKGEWQSIRRRLEEREGGQLVSWLA